MLSRRNYSGAAALSFHSQVRVSGEEDTVHVPDLTLVPVGTVEEGHGRRNGGGLVGVGLDADALLVGDGQEVVDDLGLSEPNARPITELCHVHAPRLRRSPGVLTSKRCSRVG